MAKKEKKLSNSSSSIPVITVLGHVDHGKTTLLDAIRKTNIAEREHGSITQKIGASSVEIQHEGKTRKITFIDTPGHEAFMQMRGRGAKVADIGLLVVSAVDGVMPQTKESIKTLKEAKIPYIVVLTKSDVVEKNMEKVKGQLLKEEVMLEGKGGYVPVIEVSAKTGSNIKELLDLILLVSDMSGSKVQSKNLEAVVIESRLDPKAGPRVTIVIKGGNISLRDELTTTDSNARVRTIINDKGEHLNSAGVGDAVEILGFEKTPAVGSLVYKKDEKPQVQAQIEDIPKKELEGEDSLKVIICADSSGSLEAIQMAISSKIVVVSKKTGDIEPSDVLFAKGTGAIILGFNIKIKPEVQKLAEEEKVLIRNYKLIYEMIDEIEDFLEGKRLSLVEKVLGRAKILASFPFNKQKVLGVAVLEGRIARGDKIRVERDEKNVGESTIASLRQGKEQISKVEKGAEAGILPSSELDFQVGDMLISHG